MVTFKPLFCLLVVTSVWAQNYIDRRTELCIDPNVTVYDFNHTFQSLDRERVKSWDNLQDNYRDVFDFIKSDKRSSLFNATRPWSPLLIVMGILAFITFVIFLIWCFGLCKKVHNRWCEELFTVLACIFFWTFIGLYITMIVFLGLSVYWGVVSWCQYMTIPELWFIGTRRVVNATNTFIGIKTINTTFMNFSREINAFTGGDAARTAAFSNVLSSQMVPNALAYQTNIQDFYTRYAGQKIYNSDGGLKIPRTILTFRNPYVDWRIEEDSNMLLDASGYLATASQIMLGYTTGNVDYNLAAQKTSSSRIARNYFIFTYGYDYAWTVFMRTLIKFDRWGIAMVWALFGLGIAMVILLSIVTFIVFAICCYRKCLACVPVARALLTLAAFLLVGWFIICILHLVSSTLVSAHCFFLSQVNLPQTNNTIIEDVGITINEPTRTMWRRCYDPSENNDALYVIPDDPDTLYFRRMINVINGLTAYPNFVRVLGNNSTNSFYNVNQNWTTLQNGFTYDFNDIESNLSILNQAVECGGILYSIKRTSCFVKASFSCIPIAETASVNIPSCVGGKNLTVVPETFKILKDYTTSMDDLYNDMIPDLMTRAGSPNLAFNTAKQSIIAQQAGYNTLRSIFPGTTGSATEFYNGTFVRMTNCSSVRKELIKAEDTGCFEAAYHSYVFLVTSVVAGMILFFLLWWLCGALREQQDIVLVDTMYPKTTVIQTYVQPQTSSAVVVPAVQSTGQAYMFDDFEVVPTY